VLDMSMSLDGYIANPKVFPRWRRCPSLPERGVHSSRSATASMGDEADPPGEPQAVPVDYDHDPERFRLARSVLSESTSAEDIHGRVARRLADERLLPVLDVGCGEGEMARHLPDGAWSGVDNSAEMLLRAPEPKTLGEATALPFADSSFSSVTLLYVLYHLPEPALALAEARRVLRPGGLVSVAAPSRYDSPELAHTLPDNVLTFDAELAPALLAEQFAAIEVERWDAQSLVLPTRDAVRDYLVGKGVPRDRAADAARSITAPLSVTKRGALAFARKQSTP
jgi:SAM-dependent methyltransferase